MGENAKSPKEKENHVRMLDIDKELETDDFRVAIFGSARIKEGDRTYKEIFELAKAIGARQYDIVTGGGPGLMEAANKGHTAGDKENLAESIGLNIQLPFEQSVNEYVEFEKSFVKFSDRLDTFMELSNVFIVTPGGVGTMLEFFFTWQLLQVKKMAFKPIILVGEMWEKLIHWIIDYALKDGLLSSGDFEYIYLVKDNKEAIGIIDRFHDQFKNTGKCEPIKRGGSGKDLRKCAEKKI
ncbi:LOG family protein [Patescibacteria group bacterium]|nr:LOG family protein [Patescibacteria group bacterium]MBU1702938.1 LOG family protein [Patescibacteria group bacterium]MBU1953830.1 LOG family protein [Patescibacteria group bacterium]